jgi:hypothetical protein
MIDFLISTTTFPTIPHFHIAAAPFGAAAMWFSLVFDASE